MRVLIACEFSGTVRDAFLAKGHDAMSCDLLPTDSPGPHYNGIDFGTRFQPPPKTLWANQTPSGQNKLSPSADRWKLRSTTYQGVANAMAAQWGIF